MNWKIEFAQELKSMTTQKVVFAALALAAAVCLAPSTRAQSLDVTIIDANQTVTQGTTVVDFEATVFNPSATATIYLNDGSGTTSSPFLVVDDSPFFTNAPLSLAPGQSSGPFELFAVDLASTTAAGSYSGNLFSIQGGADGGSFTAFNDLADANFSVSVTGATTTVPEIDPASAMSALTLLLGGLTVLRGRRAA
jgi:hypothetical protein